MKRYRVEAVVECDMYESDESTASALAELVGDSLSAAEATVIGAVECYQVML